MENKVAFVSGGARGMGAAEAQLFAREGAKVVIGDVLDDEGRQTEAAINELGGECLYVHLDVSSEESWTSAVAETVARFGKLNILVNNAGVVSRDEKETLGVRVLLNYGHTIGHGIEAATGYGRYLHGEAVSIGMMGAAAVGSRLGLMEDADVERQRAVLEAYGLPVALEDIDLEVVAEAMKLDKKTAAGSIRWVLLDGIGRAVTRGDVPPAVVDAALRGLRA